MTEETTMPPPTTIMSAMTDARTRVSWAQDEVAAALSVLQAAAVDPSIQPIVTQLRSVSASLTEAADELQLLGLPRFRVLMWLVYAPGAGPERVETIVRARSNTDALSVALHSHGAEESQLHKAMGAHVEPMDVDGIEGA